MSTVSPQFIAWITKIFGILTSERCVKMIRSSLLLMLLVCVVCSFCGKDFVTLGRHSWRCKQRVHQGEQDHSAQNMANQAPVMNSPNIVISRRSVIKCCCGKICKGARGLKMHQCSCRVGLNDELYNDIEEQINIDSENVPELNQSTSHEESPVNDNDVPNLRKGIKLPKSNSEWSTANEYFKFALQSNQPMRSQDLDSNIRLLNNVIYEYFATNLPGLVILTRYLTILWWISTKTVKSKI